MTGNCACGAVTVELDGIPEFIHDCNCSLCRKEGAGWGYFSAASVTVTGLTEAFERQDKATATVALQSCRHCGTTTHFTLTEAALKQYPAADTVGVNMRLFEPADLNGIEVRFPDGANWSGEGEFSYRRSAVTLSDDAPW